MYVILGLFFLLLLLSIVPTVGDLISINREDRIEKEPKPLLLKLFFIGLGAWGLAFLLETVLGSPLALLFPGTTRTLGGALAFPNYTYALGYISVFAFLVVGIIEEGIKFSLLLYFTKKAKSFDCFFDGVVYAVFVSLGFALVECLADVGNELLDCLTVEKMALGQALIQSLKVALLRAVTDIIGHLAYGVVMGYYYSQSKVTEKSWMLEYQLEERGLLVRPGGKTVFKREASLKKAFLIPAAVHGLFIFAQLLMESFPLAQGEDKVYFVALFGIVMLGIYALYLVFLKKAHKADDYLLNIAMKRIRHKYPAFAENQSLDIE